MSGFGRFTVFDAQASTATKELASIQGGWFQGAATLFLEISGASTPSWTVAIQGKTFPAGAYTNVDYIQTWQGGTTGIVNSTITVTDTTTRFYLVPNAPQFIQIVATRTTGTLTIYGNYTDVPASYWPKTSSSGDIITVSELAVVQFSGVVYTVKSAFVTATASGNTQIVASVAGKQIKVIAYTVGPVSAAVNVIVQDAAGTPVALTPTLYCAANGGIANPVIKNSTALATASTAVNVNLSANANVPVQVWYIEV